MKKILICAVILIACAIPAYAIEGSYEDPFGIYRYNFYGSRMDIFRGTELLGRYEVEAVGEKLKLTPTASTWSPMEMIHKSHGDKVLELSRVGVPTFWLYKK